MCPGYPKYDITWSLTCVCSRDKRILIHLYTESAIRAQDGRQGNDYQQCSDLRAVFSSYCVLIYLFVLIIIMPNMDECTFKWLAEELQSLIWADVHQTNTDCLSR